MRFLMTYQIKLLLIPQKMNDRTQNLYEFRYDKFLTGVMRAMEMI